MGSSAVASWSHGWGTEWEKGNGTEAENWRGLGGVVNIGFKAWPGNEGRGIKGCLL